MWLSGKHHKTTFHIKRISIMCAFIFNKQMGIRFMMTKNITTFKNRMVDVALAYITSVI